MPLTKACQPRNSLRAIYQAILKFQSSIGYTARQGREMPLAVDLLHPDPEKERQRHKLKRLVQHPNSYFMDVKCPGCFKV
ncbi:40S ribosomal protein S27 [Parelaphostrongylus tenuis]|uniref:40S ribosomal protein S27 n=1 Tax=Parelaphostrongylus tenuis TaxID=148309 RepID=A0AAD5QX51_PARTN|nr:40S ribosomal protein S27 [Parelaphostrongylus tenuis]